MTTNFNISYALDKNKAFLHAIEIGQNKSEGQVNVCTRNHFHYFQKKIVKILHSCNEYGRRALVNLW